MKDEDFGKSAPFYFSIIMKNLILTLLITVCATTISSAQTLDYTTWQSHKVITLSLRNLITIVDCSSNQFSALMKNYGYWPSKELQGSDYTHMLYENNSLDFYLDGNDGLGVNYIEQSETYRHAQIFGGLSRVYPRNALVNLRNALTPYYRDRTPNGVDRFVVEDGVGGGYLIQILIKNRTHYEVHIQHFAKLH